MSAAGEVVLLTDIDERKQAEDLCEEGGVPRKWNKEGVHSNDEAI